MKRFIFTCLTAAAMTAMQANAEPVQISVTMNNTSKTMQLVPFDGQEPVAIGEPVSNKYTFSAEPGRYLLTAYSNKGARNGTLVVNLTDGADLKVFTVTAKATNSGWILNQDYTVKTSVADAEGNNREYITGVDKSEQTAVTFLALSGDTYSVNLVPNDAHSAEGYLNYAESGIITFNKTVSKPIPMGRTFKLTVPAGASAFVGSKLRHFSPFDEVESYAVEENGENVTYSYILAEKSTYSYRVSMSGKVTTVGKFTMPADSHEITVTEADLSGDPKAIDRDVASNKKYNVGDIYLNADHTGSLSLAKGQDFQIVNLRNWEIVDTTTGNYFFEPDYHYTVIDENGQPSNDVIEVTAEGKITAKNPGTAIVLVTYDALNAPGQLGGPNFGAIWPENTGVIVVKVDASDSGITPNMLLNQDLNITRTDKLSGQTIDAELDIIYFSGDNGEYTFTPENATSVTTAAPLLSETAMTFAGFNSDNVSVNADGSYTVKLREGKNIIRMSNAAGAEYQVIRAKKAGYTITNISREGETPAPGDQVSVMLENVYHPANKLAGVYNMKASIQYDIPDGTSVASKGNQYQFAATETARTVTVTIPADWDATQPFTLISGVLKATGFGDPYGGHRDITLEKGKNPNFTAAEHTSYFGQLPEIELYKPANNDVATFENLTLAPQSYWAGDENGEEWYYGMGYKQNVTSGKYSFVNYYVPDYQTWFGFGYSNQTSTEYTALSDQYKSCVGHGYDNSANYGVAYPDGTMWGETVAVTVEGEPRTVPGFYITNSAWVANSITKGDSMTDGGFKAGDWFKLIIHAYDAEGKEIGTRDFCLADYRFENAADRYYVNDWEYVDLSQFGTAKSFTFTFDGSRKNTYGLTTPTYFCFDNFGDEGTEKERTEGTYVPEASIEDIDAETAEPAIYTVDGVKVSEMTTPGIYIVNGRKILKR